MLRVHATKAKSRKAVTFGTRAFQPISNINFSGLIMTQKTVHCLCPHCDSPVAFVGPGAGPHAARLTCSECDRFIRWVGKKELTAIELLAKALGGGL